MKHRVRPPTPEETPPNDEETLENRPFRWVAWVKLRGISGETKHYVTDIVQADQYVVLNLAGDERKTVWVNNDVVEWIVWQRVGNS